MIELITEEKIRSYDYLRIRCEFYDLWNKLFLNKKQIDKVIFRKFGRFWPLVKLLSQTLLRNLWFIPRFAGSPFDSEMILRSNQLWMIKAWEYPWALLNSHLSLNTRILDVGSGWSLFPLYLGQKSNNVDSIDVDEKQMKIISPALADIIRVKVNFFVDDTLNISAKDDTYDYVFCISVLEHLEEEVENGIRINKNAKRLDRIAIREFLRVIKPGGRVILTLDYGNKNSSPRSFDFIYIKDLINEFSANMLEPFDRFDDIRFTEEKENEVRKLWAEFFPYDPGNPPVGSIGIILTKH